MARTKAGRRRRGEELCGTLPLQRGAGTTSVASSPSWAEAKSDFFGALSHLKDEALRYGRIAARCQSAALDSHNSSGCEREASAPGGCSCIPDALFSREPEVLMRPAGRGAAGSAWLLLSGPITGNLGHALKELPPPLCGWPPAPLLWCRACGAWRRLTYLARRPLPWENGDGAAFLGEVAAVLPL